MSKLFGNPEPKKDSIDIQREYEMKNHLNMKPYLIYPENKAKDNWDLFMTFVLLLTCVKTPYDIAFPSDPVVSVTDNG